MVGVIEQRFNSGTGRFSYCFENYSTALTRDTIDAVVAQCFSSWTSAPIPIEFYRKDAENGQCKSDIVIRFLKTSDPRERYF